MGLLRVDGLFAASGRNTWYTADLHLGHERIIELCARPFGSVTEMNETIITRWNERVGQDDTVWVLGDVALGPIEESLGLVSRLNGYLILVAGNHDRCFAGYGTAKQRVGWVERYRAAGFRSVMTGAAAAAHRGQPLRHALRREFGGPMVASVTLSHFPRSGEPTLGRPDRFAEYRPRAGKGADRWLLHGHVHNRWTINDQQINVGVDVWDFAPVPAREICSIITDGMPDCTCSEGESLTGRGVHSLGEPGCALNGGPGDRVDDQPDSGDHTDVEHHTGWPDLLDAAARSATSST